MAPVTVTSWERKLAWSRLFAGAQNPFADLHPLDLLFEYVRQLKHKHYCQYTPVLFEAFLRCVHHTFAACCSAVTAVCTLNTPASLSLAWCGAAWTHRCLKL